MPQDEEEKQEFELFIGDEKVEGVQVNPDILDDLQEVNESFSGEEFREPLVDVGTEEDAYYNREKDITDKAKIVNPKQIEFKEELNMKLYNLEEIRKIKKITEIILEEILFINSRAIDINDGFVHKRIIENVEKSKESLNELIKELETEDKS